jgi:hypothetical protein
MKDAKMAAMRCCVDVGQMRCYNRKGIVASLFFVLGQRGIEEQQDPVTSGRKSRSAGNDAAGSSEKRGVLHPQGPLRRNAGPPDCQDPESDQMLQDCEAYNQDLFPVACSVFESVIEDIICLRLGMNTTSCTPDCATAPETSIDT